MISNKQKKLIHVAARRLGLIDSDSDEQYRTVLRSVCGVSSSLHISQSGFDRLLDFFQALGFDLLNGRQVAGTGPSSRQEWRIERLLKKLPGVNLAGVITQITNGESDNLEDLTRYETGKVITALIAIKQRKTQETTKDQGPMTRA